MCRPSTMNKFNFKSDFDFILKLKDKDGNAIGWPGFDWEAKIYTSNRAVFFKAWRRGGDTHNCYRDNNRIHIVAANHGLGPGELKVEFTAHLADDIYPSDIRRSVSPQPPDIELTTDTIDLIAPATTTPDKPEECVIDTGTVVTFIMDDGEEYSVQGSNLINNDSAAFEAAFDGVLRPDYYCPAQILTAYTTLKDFLPYFKVSNGGLKVKPTCFEVEPKAASACRMDFGMFTCPNGYAAIVDEIELTTYYEPTDATPAHPRLRALYQGEEHSSIGLERVPQGIARLRLDKTKVELNGGFSLEISPNTKVSFMHFLIKGHLEKIQAGYESGLSMIGEWDDPATINEENNEADTLTEHEALGA